MSKKRRCYVFCLNDYTEEEYNKLIEYGKIQAYKFIFYKKLKNLQGSLFFKRALKIDELELPIQRIKVNYSIGNFYNHYNYCNKEEILTSYEFGQSLINKHINLERIKQSYLSLNR